MPLLGLALVVIAAGCVAPAPSPGPAGLPASQSGTDGAPKRALVIATSREPNYLEPSLQPQNREWAALVAGFLAYFVPGQPGPVPYLAAELPSRESGSWRIFPDGRMETTYRLKPAARWHDGTPITAGDFVFALTARTDADFPAHNVGVERLISRATAVDDATLRLEWREPYFWAGAIHLPDFSPMPRHTLEALFRNDRAAFLDGPHWRDQFIGSGPFRIGRWEPGVEIAFHAFDQFVLGKPGLAEIRVRFINDSNTIVANLLGGSADVAYSISIGFPQGQALEEVGWSGRVEYYPEGSPRYLEFQQRDWGDTQPVVFDARVRRAAHYAIDRKSIVDEIYRGRALVAYYWLPPIDPAFPAVDRAVPKYEYDPRRSEALLREAGWTRGQDGLARNAAGESLTLPLLNLPTEPDQLEGAVVVANWKAVGITSPVRRLSPQEIRDNELRSKFPGVSYGRRALTVENMVWTSQQVSRPEARWSGQNRAGYVNPALDELWTRVLGTVDPAERERRLIEAVSVMMEDAVVVLTHITPDVMAYTADLVGPTGQAVVETSRIWNVWEWRWKELPR